MILLQLHLLRNQQPLLERRRRHNRSSSKPIHVHLQLVTLLLFSLVLLQIKFSSRCYDCCQNHSTRIYLTEAFHTTSNRRSPSKLSTPIISWNIPCPYTNNQREIQSNVVVRYQLHHHHRINNGNKNHPKIMNTQQQDTTTSNRNNNTTKESSIVTIGIRLNKVFTKLYSRRATDTLIANGRIKVNNSIVTDLGRRVIPYQDIITLDNEIYTNWEEHINIDNPTPVATTTTAAIWTNTNTSSGTTTRIIDEPTTSLDTSNLDHENYQNGKQQQQQQHIYIKYWKPVGVISTTDRNIPNNLLDSIYSSRNSNSNHQNSDHDISLQNTRRIFNVGRLDKDSSGLLLLTSDGRIPNVVLSKQFVHTKVYYVVIDRPITFDHIQQLRQGIVITTDTIRQKKHFSYTAKTLPCKIEPLYPNNGTIQSNRTITESNYIPTRKLHITLIEGRNRQIRVMLQTIGMYHVQILHRIQFMSTIDLYNLHQPGDWTYLNQTELDSLQQAIVHSKQAKSIN